MLEPQGTAADQAYTFIRDRLIAGDFEPGSRLTEWQIADLLGTSRTPVREAMRRLVGDGFLEFRRNVGTFVSRWSQGDIGDLFDLRALLESEIAAAAAAAISAGQCQMLVELQDQIESRGARMDRANLDRIGKLNRQFHGIIAQASGRPRLVKMLTDAIEAPVVQQTFRRYTEGQLRRSFHHHREMIDALRAGDALWARDAMSCHIRAARFVMVGAASREAVPRT